MLTPANLFRMMSEFIFILLGGVLAWLGLSNRFLYASNFNPLSPAWLALGAALIYWGARAWLKTARAARTSDRVVAQVGGGSLILVGVMMLSLVFFISKVSIILAAAGAVLAIRGLVGAVLSLRTD
ncbi:MAG TPA: hypothetical protein VH161_00385 [Candidatus Acidoferrales bacterium]|nr:hypothetical protein [Candidatus Acidoferrales bacterium]